MSNSFDIDTFLKDEKKNFTEFLGRLKDTSEEFRELASKTLELAAKTAAARLAGKDTELALESLKVVRMSLKSAASLQAAHATIGYIEGALIRVARTAGTILLTI